MPVPAMLAVAASLVLAPDAAGFAGAARPLPHLAAAPALPGPGGGVLPSHDLAPAASVGLSMTALIRAEEAVSDEIRRGSFPGAALAVGRWRHIVLEEGLGRVAENGPQVDPDRTVYDLASLTKVVGTTTAVMLLVEDGAMRLDDLVASYLPEFTGPAKDRVTIRHLLTHTSGLPDGISLPAGLTPEEGLVHVLRTPLRHLPGLNVEYSDLGFIVLYAAAERAAGEPLYRLLDRRVFGPLAMHSTSYAFGEGCFRCASTSRAHGEGYRGKVHDPLSRRLGGIAGNAGLFSTVHDLARFAAMLANGGELEGARVLRESTIRAFTRQQPGSGTRALGWDTPGRPGTGAAGERVSPRSFGHTGFTGTSIWVDPDRGTWVVLLANRTYEEKPSNPMQSLRRTVNNRVVEALDAGPRSVASGGN
ncbi:MAG TPA: serine hydrolase domain-containing protein [Longimicrobiaceae bacterium]|nr:serine hydrolase domain-containing protein [Longimicrobiaceae bacterium]